MNEKPVKQVLSEVRELFDDQKKWRSASLYQAGCFCLLGAIAVSEGLVTVEDFQTAEANETDAIGKYPVEQGIYDDLLKSEAVLTLAKHIADNTELPQYQRLMDQKSGPTHIVFTYNDGTDGLLSNLSSNPKKKYDLAYKRVINTLDTLIATL